MCDNLFDALEESMVGIDGSLVDTTATDAGSSSCASTPDGHTRIVSEPIAKRARTCHLDLTQSVFDAGDTLVCISIGGHGKLQGVPLHPTFTVAYNGRAVPGGWLNISSQETWLKDVIQKSMKAVGATAYKAKIIADEIKEEIRVGISKERGCNDPLIELCENGTRDFMRKNQVVSINVGDTVITCLNYVKKFIIQVDTPTAVYLEAKIRTILARLADTTVHSPTSVLIRDSNVSSPRSDSTASTVSNSPSPSAGDSRMSLNLRSKIWWEPKAFRWALTVQKPRMGMPLPDRCGFMVDKQLDGKAFDDERYKQYVRVVNAWNSVDGSKRSRIALP